MSNADLLLFGAAHIPLLNSSQRVEQTHAMIIRIKINPLSLQPGAVEQQQASVARGHLVAFFGMIGKSATSVFFTTDRVSARHK